MFVPILVIVLLEWLHASYFDRCRTCLVPATGKTTHEVVEPIPGTTLTRVAGDSEQTKLLIMFTDNI
jgi:hypothetical protein